MTLRGGEVAARICRPCVVVADGRARIVGSGDRCPEGVDGGHVFAVEGKDGGLDLGEFGDAVLIGQGGLECYAVLPPELHAGCHV